MLDCRACKEKSEVTRSVRATSWSFDTEERAAKGSHAGGDALSPKGDPLGGRRTYGTILVEGGSMESQSSCFSTNGAAKILPPNPKTL